MSQTCHVIVVGNEKGGAGKTTTSMHLIVSLLYLGYKVATIDTDSRQQSLSRYLENRENTKNKMNVNIPTSSHYIIRQSSKPLVSEKEDEERESFLEIFSHAKNNSDFIVIDTPGSCSYISKLAHSYADTVITPINDSFVDLDVLAKINSDDLKIERPSIYSQTIWEQKMQRASRDRGHIQWIVLRNRLSNTFAKNKANMADVLERLSQRIGFRVISGFSERVIFRELFLQGLTLLDLNKFDTGINVNMSHIAARQELRVFLKQLKIEKIEEALKKQDKVDVA